MENPDEWTDLKFHPTPGVGWSSKKPIFVHPSGVKVSNIMVIMIFCMPKRLANYFDSNF